MMILFIVLFMTAISFVGGALIGYAIGRYDGTEDGYMEFIEDMKRDEEDSDEI